MSRTTARLDALQATLEARASGSDDDSALVQLIIDVMAGRREWTCACCADWIDREVADTRRLMDLMQEYPEDWQQYPQPSSPPMPQHLRRALMEGDV